MPEISKRSVVDRLRTRRSLTSVKQSVTENMWGVALLRAGSLHQISLRGEIAWGKHALSLTLNGLAPIEEASSLWLRAPPLQQRLP